MNDARQGERGRFRQQPIAERSGGDQKLAGEHQLGWRESARILMALSGRGIERLAVSRGRKRADTRVVEELDGLILNGISGTSYYHV